ncbi:MAG: aldo/keto reductase [Proteobacteria bacterium]|nr:aldo/keto reductase [Pseudomonadota bacterium]
MPFDPSETRRIGATQVEISRLGLGTAPLGGWPEAVSRETGIGTIRRAWDRGIRYFDTAPFYGAGQAELFLGEALAGKPRAELRISTKTGRRLVAGPDEVAFFKAAQPFHSVFDFSADGVEASIHDSQMRLGLGSPDVVLVHDPDDHHADVLRMAYPKLRAMREAGHFGALGVGMNGVEPLVRFAQEADFDVFLLAGRYTLLDQSALDELFPLVAERGISVIAGGVFNSGLLIAPAEGAMYDYAPAGAEILGKAKALAAVCRDFETPLRAAALQFAAAHPAVTSVVVGARTPEEVDDTLANAALSIPAELWTALKHRGLLREDAPVPGPGV